MSHVLVDFANPIIIQLAEHKAASTKIIFLFGHVAYCHG